MFPNTKYLQVLACLLLYTLQHVTANNDEAKALETLQRAPRVKRTIGGNVTQEGEYPEVCHLWGKVKSGSWWRRKTTNYYCGGTLIGPRHVLTAAHCFREHDNAMTPKYWHIKVGETESKPGVGARILSWIRRGLGSDDYLVQIHAEKIIISPDYNKADSWFGDLAVIVLRQAPPARSTIKEAKLPDASNTNWPSAYDECYFIGWGCDQHGGSIVNERRAARLPRVGDNECHEDYGRTFSMNRRLCAGRRPTDRARDLGICPGDSGSPLLCKKDDDWMLAGVASFTSSQNPGQHPGVFTKVSDYVNWLKGVMRWNP